MALSDEKSMSEGGPNKREQKVRRQSSMWGLFDRRLRWGLSWRGRLLTSLLVVVLSVLTILTIQPFLAVTHRENTDVLVVEGWVNQQVMVVAAEEIKNGSYCRVYTTGGPVAGFGGYIDDEDTSANVGARLLRKAGVPEDMIQAVPSRVSGRDRTYSSAVALKNWLREHHVSVHSINILTEGAHARRTELLFQTAFGKDVATGVISVPNPDYDPKRWWRYSAGVREVIGEGIAYVYAKFLFWPTSPEK